MVLRFSTTKKLKKENLNEIIREKDLELVTLKEKNTSLIEKILYLEKLLNRLPILNLYEKEIKQKIDKWFISESKSDIIEDFKNKLEILNPILFLEKDLNLLISDIIDLKERFMKHENIISIQKREILGSKRFYEKRINDLLLNQNESISKIKKEKEKEYFNSNGNYNGNSNNGNSNNSNNTNTNTNTNKVEKKKENENEDLWKVFELSDL